MKVYLSGIVHGSQQDNTVYDQEYREQIRKILADKYRDVTISSPVEELDQDSLRKRDTAETAFFSQIEEALTSDLVVAYLPAASMGSAIEIWEAYKNSKPIVVISPLQENWTVRFLSTRSCPDLEAFGNMVARGELDEFLLDRYERRG